MSGVRNEVDESRSYLQQLLVTFDGAEEEDKALILERAYGEIAPKIGKIISDRLVSPVVEELFSKSSLENLDGFIAALSPDIILECGTNPFGSHVLEKLLLRIQSQHEAHQQAVEHCFISFSSLLEPNVGVLLSEQHATYILRAMFKALGGLEIIPRSKHTKAEEKINRVYPPSKRLQKALGQLFAALREKLFTEDLYNLAFHVSASPTLQVLLEALPSRKKDVDDFAAAILPVDPDAVRFSEMAHHHVASHLLERIVALVSDERYAIYYNAYFRHHLVELCERPSPSFVVQQLIANTRDAPQLEMHYAELRDSWPVLLKQNRAGVVLRLLEACNKRSVLQKKAAKLLQDAVNQLFPGTEKPFIQKVLDISKPKEAISSIGSLIAIEVLRATTAENRALLESFLALSADYIIAMAKTSTGSQVLEVFLDVLQPPPLKKKFVKKLYSHFLEFARDKYGSHCLDKLYRSSEVEQKQKIAEELAVDFEALSKDFYGRFAVRNCRVESFVRAKEGWQNAETTSEKKRKQFMEIFEGEDAADSGAVVSKKKHSKSKTKPAAAGGDDGEENDDEQQDIQMSDKAQKIYDSLLPTAGTAEGDDGEAPAVQDKNEKADEDDGFMTSIRSALRGTPVSGDAGHKKKKQKSKNKRKESATDE